VVVALVISALLEPVRRILLRWGASTTVAWLVAFLFGVVVVSSIMVLAISEFSANFDELSEQAAGGVDEFTNWLEDGPLRMDAGGLNDAVDKAFASIKDDPTEAITGTVSVLSTTSSLLAAGVLTLLTTLFFMKDRSLMWMWFTRLFPERSRQRVDSAGRAGWEVLISYTRVTLTSAVVDSTVIGIASAIAGLPVAFALAVVVFLFAFIPTVGAIFSGLVVVLVALVSQGPTTALVMAIIVLIVQQLDANVMYPILASRHLALHPLASLLLVAGGGVVAGLFGAFIAVPLAAVLLAVGGDVRRSSILRA
ncbi:MAG TPA: AI-2E family transporter, partial [Microthrixaceae bacterium]|nr:AI-2E family transporter [Microthrixaceae bacterium]